MPPRDWAEQQAYRISLEIKRLRGERSAQWIADRTQRIGYPITRTVISDLEVGRRRYVTTAELIVLAQALDTAPISLLYPGPYEEEVEALPGDSFDQLTAVAQFCGFAHRHEGADEDEQIESWKRYDHNMACLRIAREIADLELTKTRLMKARESRSGWDDDDYWQGLQAVADVQMRIDDLQDRLDHRNGR
ncbi:hypothetical protein MTY66_57890 [Mycolicibacterium sp. TY66]|nr:hypothetical protein MTY66_57890 [Mycolicibacterium sp. TY66]BCJ84216.1 hypothetical protein MTY81_55890 [Mycolicibacterium sp. TY81]